MTPAQLLTFVQAEPGTRGVLRSPAKHADMSSITCHVSGPVLCCTVLYCTVLYCTVLYCTVLKVMSKQHLVETLQQEHVFSEREVMAACSHQFITRWGDK